MYTRMITTGTLGLLVAILAIPSFGQETTLPYEGQSAAVQNAPANPMAGGQPLITGQSYLDAGSCSSGCGGEGGWSSGCCDQGGCGLFGRNLIKPSDHCFDCFISPMTNPVFFEDPRQVTEARGIFFNHQVPLAAGSNEVRLYAVQLRARLTENVSLIATKDGYIKSSNPIVGNGWADLAAGLKFSLIRDVENQRLLSGGFTFEVPTGEASALQNNGHGELNLFLTGGKRIGSRSHWISATGLRVPMNNTDESTVGYWSNHFDYLIGRRVYWLAELNWYHWLQAGKDGPLPGVEGLDVFNLGSPGVAGNDIVTAATGMKIKPNGHNEIGVAFEFPLTERRDIIDNRLTVDWIIRY